MTTCVFCGNEATFVDEDSDLNTNLLPAMCYTCNQAFNSGFERGYIEGKRSTAGLMQMINQKQLFQLYRAMTGKSVYVQEITVPAMPEQRWQAARVRDYAFMQEVR